MPTMPFPSNGADANPQFNGHDLLLLKHATPPAMLLENISRLGCELDEGRLLEIGNEHGFHWPAPAGSELEAILQPEALLKVCGS
jgi:hypothetical protein